MAEKKNRSGGASRVSKQTEKALPESERRYRLLFDNMTTAFALHEMLYDEQGNPVDYRFLDANKAFEQLTGLSVASILGRTVLEVLPGTERHWIETYAKVVQSGTPVLFEDYSGVLAKWFEVRAFSTVRNQFATIFADITARKQAEAALLKAGALQNAIFNSANFSSIATDAKGVIQIFNVGAERMLGYTAAEVMNRITPADISDPEEVIARAKALSAELGTPITPGFEALVFKASRGIEDIYELTYIRKDGSRFPAVVSVTALRDAQNAIIGYLLIGTDNTARKQAEAALLKAEAYSEMGREVLQILSEPGDLQDSIQRVLAALKARTGFDAVGIRLQDGDDFPYLVQEGFPKDFLLTENTLIERGADGGVCRDSNGNVSLECTCGLVISGKTDPANPLFTPGGSCWTNDSFPILDTPPGEDPRHNPRNQCIHKGYASIALVPIRNKDSIVGLIQLNDLRKGRFTLGTVNLLEEIASHIGEALMRKQAEEALRKAGALQSAIFNSANFSSIATDAKGVIQIFNVGAERMLGYAAADVMNKITPADISDPQEVIARAKALSVELGTPITPGFEALVFKASRGIEDIYELTYIRKDGSRFPAVVSVTALRDAQNAIIGYLLIGTDNTARKQIEEDRKLLDQRLRDQQFYTRSLIESNIDALMTTDPSGIITDVNKQMEALTGSTRDDLIGSPFKNYFTDPERAEASLKLVLSQKKITNCELTVRARDGGETAVWYNATTFYDRERTLQGMFAVARDISKQKRADAQLSQSQKMEAIGTLAGGVAHDFNNLLTGILGNIALVRGGLAPADPLLENLDAAETAAHQAAMLTKGLLTFGRSAVVVPVPMKITDAIDATLVLLKQSLPATMQIARDDGQTAWNVLLDQSQMTQILLNLAVNARDAMEGKGTLTIRTRNEVVEEDYVQSHPFARTGEFVHLSVTDTGPGIPPAILEHLFEPFHTTKPVGSGTGLGLSIVYGAVKQADGWVTADSPQGAGTVFDIYLPRCLEEPTESFTPGPLPVKVGSGIVLVVEDEPVVCAVAQAFLNRGGYTVLTATDGASALNVLREHPADVGLVLLDMTMPGMTFGEIVQAVRALDPTIPILLNSGYTSNGAVRQMLAEHSVQGFLGKPYSLGELTHKVQELLHRG